MGIDETVQALSNNDDEVKANAISAKAALIERSKYVKVAQPVPVSQAGVEVLHPMPEPHADIVHRNSQENEDDKHPTKEVSSCQTASEATTAVDEKEDVTLTLPLADTFPQRLMEILDNEAHANIIGWLTHGRAFQIYRRIDFESIVLPQYFNKQSKYSSFSRKLKRWGFIRVTRGPETGAYYHQVFKQGAQHFCMRMSCHSTGTGTSKSSAAATLAKNAYATTSSMPHPFDFAPTSGFQRSFAPDNHGIMMLPHHLPCPPYPHVGHPHSSHPFNHLSVPEYPQHYPSNYAPYFFQQHHPHHMPQPQGDPPLLNGQPYFHSSYPNQIPHAFPYPHGPYQMYLGSHQDPQSSFVEGAEGLSQRQMESGRDEEISSLAESLISLSVPPQFHHQHRVFTPDSDAGPGPPPHYDESQAYPYRHPNQYVNSRRTVHDGSRHPLESAKGYAFSFAEESAFSQGKLFQQRHEKYSRESHREDLEPYVVDSQTHPYRHPYPNATSRRAGHDGLWHLSMSEETSSFSNAEESAFSPTVMFQRHHIDSRESHHKEPGPYDESQSYPYRHPDQF